MTESSSGKPLAHFIDAGYVWLSPVSASQKTFLLFFLLVFAILTPIGIWDGKIAMFGELWWFVSFSVALLIPSFIQARRMAVGELLRNIPPDFQMFHERYRQYVSTKEDGWGPSLLGLVIGLFFFVITFLTSRDVTISLASPFFWLRAVTNGFGFGFFARAFWLLLCFGHLVNEISRMFEKHFSESFSFELLERAGEGYGRTAMGAALLSGSLLWMFLANLWFFGAMGLSVSTRVLLIEVIFAGVVLFPFTYLVLPQFRFHRMLVRRKEEIRKLFFTQFLQTERDFIRQPNRDLAQKYLLERQIMAEIENLPEWPIRLQTLFPALTVVVVPAGLFLIKEVIVNVIVNLLK